MASKSKSKSKKHEHEHAAAASVPLDVVSLILLKAAPCALWSSRLVCKHWYTLIRSPEFVADRKSATGGTWLVTMHHMRRSTQVRTNTSYSMRRNSRAGRAGSNMSVRVAWILIYNPLLNIQEKVSFPIYQVWPNAKRLLLYDLSVRISDSKNSLTVQASFARATFYVTWNPISGSIQPLPRYNFIGPIVLPAPQDVAGPGWRLVYRHGGLMAVSASSLKIFQSSRDTWEFMGAMPDDMRQTMGENDISFVATPNYYLIWTLHAQESETVALFQPMKGSWTWVDNIWHSQSHLCRWNEMVPHVISAF